jgi:hypothetical protein
MIHTSQRLTNIHRDLARRTPPRSLGTVHRSPLRRTPYLYRWVVVKLMMEL